MHAIRDGRLTDASLSRTDRGYWKIDPAAADVEWEEHSDPNKRRDEKPSGRPGRATSTPPLFEEQRDLLANRVTHAQASARKVDLDADLKALQLQRERGELIDVAAVRSEAFRGARVVRDSIMAIPDRIAAELAAESAPQKVHGRLVEELAAACETLSEDFAERVSGGAS